LSEKGRKRERSTGNGWEDRQKDYLNLRRTNERITEDFPSFFPVEEGRRKEEREKERRKEFGLIIHGSATESKSEEWALVREERKQEKECNDDRGRHFMPACLPACLPHRWMDGWMILVFFSSAGMARHE